MNYIIATLLITMQCGTPQPQDMTYKLCRKAETACLVRYDYPYCFNRAMNEWLAVPLVEK